MAEPPPDDSWPPACTLSPAVGEHTRRERKHTEVEMQLDVQHDPNGNRFHVPPEVIDGEPQHKMANMGTVLSYQEIRPGVLDLRSTLVPPHLRGQGIGTQLVRQALDWVRQNEYTIVPTCPFVQDFLEKNPEYEDLIAEEN